MRHALGESRVLMNEVPGFERAIHRPLGRVHALATEDEVGT